MANLETEHFLLIVLILVGFSGLIWWLFTAILSAVFSPFINIHRDLIREIFKPDPVKHIKEKFENIYEADFDDPMMAEERKHFVRGYMAGHSNNVETAQLPKKDT